MPLKADAVRRGLDFGRMLMLCALLGVCLYGAVKTALTGIWVIAGLFTVCSVLGLAMLWATGRQMQRGRRDNPAHLVFGGVVTLVVLVLIVLRLAV